ncbi:hypothetical protein BY996DRAFT_7816022 [Phakopsora pachyrhizi]|uniref:Uncharacterized protein n=1 Tax=Phakopsora pachyrhizi TaxID=170000 RepID=A0AAV0AZ77_PHAPC|nr:hypothetical protein BY996DRAFT_8205361 [Phakopsora pachyrhizi]KAI8446501.1 hypothetical protein BY996DRAFT_7816022 [Phakopsora pachyrhizi]CAH7674857.1 hypothetical protein PPACK8108_LOCUS9787 [Phakopsora pachyrhizi]CAH7675413.1 hypothetical protein PPACK8108_LOCUS10419 [Phakopsora pachyrhizi]
MSTTVRPPVLPPRPTQETSNYSNTSSSLISDDIDPPPAYTPSASTDNPIVESGPRYPFGQDAGGSQNQTSQHPYHPPYPSAIPGSTGNVYTNQNHQYHQPQGGLAGVNYGGTILNYNGYIEPTQMPVPGRPLMYENQVLIYPGSGNTLQINGHHCYKCNNTGFKSFDPNRPCKKCWDKFGRPWSAVRLSPSSQQTNLIFQRPLPSFQPVYHPQGQSYPSTGYYPQGQFSGTPSTMVTTSGSTPLVVRPGDPRIGGRLCLNCNGSGSRSDELNLLQVFFGGGQETCRACRGTGRVF